MQDKKMKAVVIEQYGGKEVLTVQEKKIPTLAADEVLVKVHAAGVNPIDWKIRNGDFRSFIRIKFPYTPGIDIAGIVEDVGTGVTEWKKGDRVFAMLSPTKASGYAEYVDVLQSQLVRIPKNIRCEEAASLPTAGIAAYDGLVTLGQLKENQDVLVNGASGGVGTIAVQMAKALGAKAVTGVTSTKNIEFVKELGATGVIDYTKKQFQDEDEIYEIVFDTVGNASFMGARRILEPKGKFVSTIGNTSNMVLSFLTSLWTGRKCKFINAQPSRKKLEAVAKLVEDGSIKPVIDKKFSLDESKKAHEYSESRRARGKIVITME